MNRKSFRSAVLQRMQNRAWKFGCLVQMHYFWSKTCSLKKLCQLISTVLVCNKFCSLIEKCIFTSTTLLLLQPNIYQPLNFLDFEHCQYYKSGSITHAAIFYDFSQIIWKLRVQNQRFFLLCIDLATCSLLYLRTSDKKKSKL